MQSFTSQLHCGKILARLILCRRLLATLQELSYMQSTLILYSFISLLGPHCNMICLHVLIAWLPSLDFGNASALLVEA